MSRDARATTRTFFYLVYVVMGLIWLTTVAVPTWRPLSMALPFTLLILLQGILHGQVERIRSQRWAILYLLVQSVLAVALVVLSDGGPMVEALFAPIAGEAVGLLPTWRGRITALGGVLVAWILATLWHGDTVGMLVKLPWTGAAFGFSAIYVLLYMRQIQERERAESLLAQLQEAHRQLRSYAGQIEELTITQERQRMARELHDTLAQGLAGLVMQLEAADELLERSEPDRARTLIQRAMARTRQTLAEARASIGALRLPMEREGELADALKRELDRAEADAGLKGVLEINPGELVMDGEIAAQLFYIAREGIANTVRHAQATQLVVSLWGEGDWVALGVTDDGIGFDPAAVIGRAGHFGLTGLYERAHLVGGTVEVASSPAKGCRLIARLPRRLSGGGEAYDQGADRR